MLQPADQRKQIVPAGAIMSGTSTVGVPGASRAVLFRRRDAHGVAQAADVVVRLPDFRKLLHEPLA